MPGQASTAKTTVPAVINFHNYVTVLSILCILGVLGCGSVFDTGYLFTKELFPTVVLTTILASASAIASTRVTIN